MKFENINNSQNLNLEADNLTTNQASIKIDRDQEKIALIEKLLKVNYSPEEMSNFDNWLDKTTNTAIEKKAVINQVKDILDLLPPDGNYTDKKINLYFEKQDVTNEEMQSFMTDFSQTNPNYEISLVKNNNNLLVVGIGGKVRNPSTIFAGEYFGHYHPTQLEFNNQDVLPDCFIKGLMPSAGDVKGYLKYAESINNGTRIFSKNGYVSIKPKNIITDADQKLADYKDKYFDLFLNINKLNLKSDEEVNDYFVKNFGLEITFYYTTKERT